MSTDSLLILVSLWLLAGVSAVEVVLAARAVVNERREGLRSSKPRLVAVGGVFLLVAFIVTVATASALSPSGEQPAVSSAPLTPPTDAPSAVQSSPAEPPPTRPEATGSATARAAEQGAASSKVVDETAPKAASRPQRTRAELESERARLENELAAINQELSALAPTEPPPRKASPVGAAGARPTTPPAPVGLPAWLVFAVGCLVLIGALLLAFLGDMGTLWLPASLRRKLRALKGKAGGQELTSALDLAAADAASGRYEEALSRTAEIQEPSLDTLDVLDLLFLRAFCAAQIAAGSGRGEAIDAKRRADLLTEAVRDLTRLLELAPDMAEAHYLLAFARELRGEHDLALEGFRAASEKLPRSSLPFDHNESVVWLAVAEKRLQSADSEGANSAFNEVARLGVLAAEVPVTLAVHRFARIRDDLKERRFAQAREEIAQTRRIEGLDAERKAQTETACDIYEMLAHFREGDYKATRERVHAALERWAPPDLPEPEPAVADDIFPAVAPESLKLAPELFRGLYFLLAVATVRDGSRGRRPLSEADAIALSRILFRALQFEPRHRDILAALGVLTYRCMVRMRPKALEWIRAAVTMGVRSAIVRRLLEQDRLLEAERRDLLDRFMSASGRFLEDPTVRPQVRRALIEELGRFQEFQPLLIDLDQTTEAGQRSPTLEVLRERARYVHGLASDVASRKRAPAPPHLATIQREYAEVIAAIEASAARLGEIERRVIEEVGKVVLG